MERTVGLPASDHSENANSAPQRAISFRQHPEIPPTPPTDIPAMVRHETAKHLQNMQATFKVLQAISVVLNGKFLLLLGILFAGLLSLLVTVNPEATMQKMMMVAVFDALVLFPLVALNARKP